MDKRYVHRWQYFVREYRQAQGKAESDRRVRFYPYSARSGVPPMSFRDYIGTKALSLCMAGIGGLYLILVSYFCGIPFSLLLVILSGGMMIILAGIVIGWLRTDRRLRMLRHRLDALPDQYLIGETLDRPGDALEMEYYLLMKEISRSAIGAVEQARAEKQDYCDYVESWVHEIKTPLTACSLILSNGGDTAKLRRELRRADNLSETILTYAKLRTAQKDTQISCIDLRHVCDQAIREEMELLIAVDISITMDGDCFVYTDPRLRAVAASLEITEQLSRFPRQLSGGQRQRAACARALITRPALILADEPTGALDSANTKGLMQTFMAMNQSLGSTILMVTHDAVVGSYADRILFLKDGRIWNELHRGNRSRQAMYHEILNTMAVLGGEADVR